LRLAHGWQCLAQVTISELQIWYATNLYLFQFVYLKHNVMFSLNLCSRVNVMTHTLCTFRSECNVFIQFVFIMTIYVLNCSNPSQLFHYWYNGASKKYASCNVINLPPKGPLSIFWQWNAKNWISGESVVCMTQQVVVS
jgi:hypothetical protein